MPGLRGFLRIDEGDFDDDAKLDHKLISNSKLCSLAMLLTLYRFILTKGFGLKIANNGRGATHKYYQYNHFYHFTTVSLTSIRVSSVEGSATYCVVVATVATS